MVSVYISFVGFIAFLIWCHKRRPVSDLATVPEFIPIGNGTTDERFISHSNAYHTLPNKTPFSTTINIDEQITPSLSYSSNTMSHSSICSCTCHSAHPPFQNNMHSQLNTHSPHSISDDCHLSQISFAINETIGSPSIINESPNSFQMLHPAQVCEQLVAEIEARS